MYDRRIGSFDSSGAKPPSAAPANSNSAEAGSIRAPTAPKPPSGPSFIGTWIGDVDQVGRGSTYPIVLTISTKGDTTSYANQGCSGTLTRIGASANYVFYVEKITKGAFSAATNTGCIDGTITLAKAGNQLLFSWFGVSNSQLYQASATLIQSAAPTGK